MPVFQCTKELAFRFKYNQYKLFEGQPVATNTPDLVRFFKEHVHFKEVDDPVIVKLAPPLHLVKQVFRPRYMSKDEILRELRLCGINEDPCQLFDILATKLQTVRKVTNRTFVTVLDEHGRPVFADDLKSVPRPLFGNEVDTLPEPPEPKLDEYTPISEEDTYMEFEDDDPEVQQAELKLVNANNKDGTAGVVERFNEDNEDDKGSYDEFLNEKLSNESNPRLPAEKELQVKELLNPDKDKKEVAQDDIHIEVPREDLDTENIDTPDNVETKDKEYFEDDSILDVMNWRYLVDMKEDGLFVTDAAKENDIDNFKVVKKTKINQMVYERFLILNGIEKVEADENNNKRWNTINKAFEVIEDMSEVEKTKAYVSLNYLQKRFEEISKFEPDYRKFTEKQMRRRLTQLTKYGVNISFDEDTDIKKYTKKVFMLAKLGVNVPSEMEEIDQLLERYDKL